MESTSPPKYARDDPHIARMVMTPQGWMPGGSCWCGAASRDHLRQKAPGKWRCTKCNTRYRQRWKWQPEKDSPPEPLAKSVFGRVFA